LVVKSVVIALVFACAPAVWGAAVIPTDLKPPAEDGIWFRPATGGPAEPTIGFKQGIRIGLWPAPRGPRGIIRIYAPYVLPTREHPLINFIAIEPIVNGRRSLSELEHSAADDARGKRMWFTDEVSESSTPGQPWDCPKGKLDKIHIGGKDVRTLSIAVNIEKLDNGAQPVVLATFREDRPNEVSFKVYSTKAGAAMESCVLTATMGNFSRTRLLWLADEVIDSRKLWPGYTGTDFVWTDEYPMDRVRRDRDGTFTVAITPNETDLSAAKMPLGGWTFDGLVSTQYWRKYPGTVKPPLRVRVNGRAVYYGGSTEIPGGVAFENFEIIENYEPGVQSTFGATLQTPTTMGWKMENK
jgi:hypothetical protein